MGERPDDEELDSYPVKMVLVEVGWILNTPQGHEFLSEVYHSGNLELYDLDLIKIVIEYLYDKYKVRVLRYQLPCYLIVAVVFLVTVFYHERLEDEQDKARQISARK